MTTVHPTLRKPFRRSRRHGHHAHLPRCLKAAHQLTVTVPDLVPRSRHVVYFCSSGDSLHSRARAGPLVCRFSPTCRPSRSRAPQIEQIIDGIAADGDSLRRVPTATARSSRAAIPPDWHDAAAAAPAAPPVAHGVTTAPSAFWRRPHANSSAGPCSDSPDRSGLRPAGLRPISRRKLPRHLLGALTSSAFWSSCRR